MIRINIERRLRRQKIAAKSTSTLIAPNKYSLLIYCGKCAWLKCFILSMLSTPMWGCLQQHSTHEQQTNWMKFNSIEYEMIRHHLRRKLINIVWNWSTWCRIHSIIIHSRWMLLMLDFSLLRKWTTSTIHFHFHANLIKQKMKKFDFSFFFLRFNGKFIDGSWNERNIREHNLRSRIKHCNDSHSSHSDQMISVYRIVNEWQLKLTTSHINNNNM